MQALENRIPPPLVFLIVALAMWGLAQLSPASEGDAALRFTAAAIFAACGFLFAAPAVRAFRRAGTTINPVDIEAASSLVTGGIYGYTRNPMYVGLAALLLAWSAYLAAPWTALGPLAFLAFITRFQIMPEERVMRAKFGAAYEAYCKKVRRWL
jgi:protein-S-isoprenylcysteine O-methyltransferase Ste14